jgi:hypothetical protein
MQGNMVHNKQNMYGAQETEQARKVKVRFNMKNTNSAESISKIQMEKTIIKGDTFFFSL